jgi:IS30 family transposase
VLRLFRSLGFTGFHHLSCAERALAFAEARRVSSQRKIARCLGRSASTICQELRHGREALGDGGSYCPERGVRAHKRGRLHCRPRRKLVKGGALWRFVWHHLVQFRWSPEEIAATLLAMHTSAPQARVSHETIYAMIYA